MGKIGWVCATCTRDFTRKSSAKRHNSNFHFGKGKVVRLLEYIIGRVSGEYIASDPSQNRRNKTKKQFLFGHNTNAEVGYAAVADTQRNEFTCGTKRESMINESTYKQDNTSLHRLSHSGIETLDKAVSRSLDNFQTMSILWEVNDLVRRWCSTEEIQNILLMWKVFLMTSNTDKIYKSLEWLRELSNSKESSCQPVSQERLASLDSIWRWAADNRIKFNDNIPKIHPKGNSSQAPSSHQDNSDMSDSSSPNKLRQAASANISSRVISQQGLDTKQRIPEIPGPPEIPYKS
jgi:hypothetical protein